MKLKLHVVDRGSLVEFTPSAVVIAGFTGRDRAKLQEHVEELAREGIQVPSRVPAFYEVPCSLLTTGEEIRVTSERTSGEVESVLFCTPQDWYVGVGSDHTDRELERTDIAASKRACAKVISTRVFAYSAVAPRWDEIVIRSWAGGSEAPYQQARLETILPPGELIAGARDIVGNTADSMVVFLGTVPARSGHFEFSSVFEAELEAPGIGQTLRIRYRVVVAEDQT